MPHKHKPSALVHDLPKAECDVLWREYLHFHPGERCDVRDEPDAKGKTVRRCVLLAPAKTRELKRLHALVVSSRDRPITAE